MVEEPLGKDELQNGVAEKLKALIIKVMALSLVPERWVGQRLRQQERIAKLIFQALFEWIHQTLKSITVGGDERLAKISS